MGRVTCQVLSYLKCLLLFISQYLSWTNPVFINGIKKKLSNLSFLQDEWSPNECCNSSVSMKSSPWTHHPEGAIRFCVDYILPARGNPILSDFVTHVASSLTFFNKYWATSMCQTLAWRLITYQQSPCLERETNTNRSRKVLLVQGLLNQQRTVELWGVSSIWEHQKGLRV